MWFPLAIWRSAARSQFRTSGANIAFGGEGLAQLDSSLVPRRRGKSKRLTKRVLIKPDGRYLIYYERSSPKRGGQV
jgi:hypothetical protein